MEGSKDEIQEYLHAIEPLRDMHQQESKYTKAAQKRVDANIQAAYDAYKNGTKLMDTLAKATEKVL